MVENSLACQTHREQVSFSDECENSQLIRISQEYLSHLITISFLVGSLAVLRTICLDWEVNV